MGEDHLRCHRGVEPAGTGDFLKGVRDGLSEWTGR